MKTYRITFRDYWDSNARRIQFTVRAKTIREAGAKAQLAIQATPVGTGHVITQVKEVR